MKVIGTIQARMGSTRLPGKVLKEVCGKPLLGWQIDRLRRARLLDDVVVTTTTNPLDDQIVDYCISNGVSYYRGSEDDVLKRVANTIREYDIDVHVEFFGDSPLTDPHIVDELIGLYLKENGRYDCVCNFLKTSYPPGMEVLVHRGSALTDADLHVAAGDPMREHVSIHMTKNSEIKVLNVEAPAYYHYPGMYLEVDTENDFRVITTIIEFFSDKSQNHFSLAQIIDYLQVRQELVAINQAEERRWKEFRDDK